MDDLAEVNDQQQELNEVFAQGEREIVFIVD
jgi:hypothetical protein